MDEMMKTDADRSLLRTAGVPAAFLLSVALLLLSACASSSDRPGVVKRTLQSMGLQDEQAREARDITLELHAGENLNAGIGSRANAVVVQIYQLRDSRRFEQMGFETLLDENQVKQALGDDLLMSREITLLPGTRQDLTERAAPGIAALGVVALFQAAAPNRWKFAFDASAQDADPQPISIGVHACALTTASEALMTRLASDASSLASVRCAR